MVEAGILSLLIGGIELSFKVQEVRLCSLCSVDSRCGLIPGCKFCMYPRLPVLLGSRGKRVEDGALYPL